MPATLVEAREIAMAAYYRERFPGGQPLWPTRFCDPTFDCAWAFIRELRTWNEAAGLVQPFPDREYLQALTALWIEQRALADPLFVEKCRRMLVSWLFRALELWALGCERTDEMLVGETYGSASKHVWRLKHLYEDLRARNDGWKLPESDSLAYEGERALTQFSLPNGSMAMAINGQSKALQGEGVSIITLEEFATYRHGKSMLAQAQIITQGAAKGRNGFVVAVTNSSASGQWQEVKKSLLA